MCVAFLFCGSVLAQPPIVVDWMSELPDDHTILAAFINPNNGHAEVIYNDNGNAPCYIDEYWIGYSALGLPPNAIEPWSGCLSAQGASLDHFVTATSRPGYPRMDVLNVSTLNNHFYIYCNGLVIEGLDIGPPGYGFASAYCVLADGANVYIGGSSTSCSPSGWTHFQIR